MSGPRTKRPTRAFAQARILILVLVDQFRLLAGRELEIWDPVREPERDFQAPEVFCPRASKGGFGPREIVEPTNLPHTRPDVSMRCRHAGFSTKQPGAQLLSTSIDSRGIGFVDTVMGLLPALVGVVVAVESGQGILKLSGFQEHALYLMIGTSLLEALITLWVRFTVNRRTIGIDTTN